MARRRTRPSTSGYTHLVQRMASQHRLPDALRRADALASRGLSHSPRCWHTRASQRTSRHVRAFPQRFGVKMVNEARGRRVVAGNRIPWIAGVGRRLLCSAFQIDVVTVSRSVSRLHGHEFPGTALGADL